MRNYEITAIIKENAVEETKNTIKEIFAKNSVDVTAEEDWGSKTVWQPINHIPTGFFAHYKCSVKDTSVIASLENEFKLNQNIMRSMISRA